MGIQDWVVAYRIGLPRFRLVFLHRGSLAFALLMFALAIAVFYYGYALAWQRQHSFPWHYIHIMMFAFAAGPAAFILSHWSMSARKVVLENHCVTVQSHFSGKVPIAWRLISGIYREAEYIVICSRGLAALVIPHRAFPNERAAAEFFDMALSYWHTAKGMSPPPIPDVYGVWPPAPSASNSVEPGDNRKR